MDIYEQIDRYGSIRKDNPLMQVLEQEMIPKRNDR